MQELPTLPVLLCGAARSGKEALFYRFVHRSFSTAASARPSTSGSLTGLRSVRLQGKPTVFVACSCTKGDVLRVTTPDILSIWGDPAHVKAVVLVVDGEAAFLDGNIEEAMGALLDGARAMSRKTNRGDILATFAISKCDLIPESPPVAFGDRVQDFARAQGVSSFFISSKDWSDAHVDGPLAIFKMLAHWYLTINDK